MVGAASQAGQLGSVGDDTPGQRGQCASVAVADGGRLAGEHEAPARLEYPNHLPQRQLDVGNVVQHRMPDHEVESVVVVRDALGVGDPAVDV